MGTDITELKLGNRNKSCEVLDILHMLDIWNGNFKLIIPFLSCEMWAYDKWNLFLQDFFRNPIKLVILYPKIDSFLSLMQSIIIKCMI